MKTTPNAPPHPFLSVLISLGKSERNMQCRKEFANVDLTLNMVVMTPGDACACGSKCGFKVVG
jgi:hypothetical protein